MTNNEIDDLVQNTLVQLREIRRQGVQCGTISREYEGISTEFRANYQKTAEQVKCLPDRLIELLRSNDIENSIKLVDEDLRVGLAWLVDFIGVLIDIP